MALKSLQWTLLHWMLGIAMELLYTAFILKRNENLDFFFFMLKYFIFKCGWVYLFIYFIFGVCMLWSSELQSLREYCKMLMGILIFPFPELSVKGYLRCSDGANKTQFSGTLGRGNMRKGVRGRHPDQWMFEKCLVTSKSLVGLGCPAEGHRWQATPESMCGVSARVAFGCTLLM